MTGGPVPTRERILDAALERFGTRGVEAVSLDDIAVVVGVRKQTVLYWFPSKDELVDAVLEEAAHELAVVVDAAVRAAPANPLDQVDAVVRAAFATAVRRPALLGLVRELSRLPGDRAERLRAHVDPLVQRAIVFLTKAMDDGRAAPRRPGPGGRHRVRHRHRASAPNPRPCAAWVGSPMRPTSAVFAPSCAPSSAGAPWPRRRTERAGAFVRRTCPLSH